MEKNEVMSGVRFALHLLNNEVRELIHQGGGEVSPLEVVNLLKKEDEPDYLPCSAERLHQFFDGLILKRRGPLEGEAPKINTKHIDNNVILRKIRIAFALKDVDVIELLKKTGFAVTKSELGAMARKKDHPHYMKCGDQLIRYLLKGMVMTYRPEGLKSINTLSQ